MERPKVTHAHVSVQTDQEAIDRECGHNEVLAIAHATADHSSDPPHPSPSEVSDTTAAAVSIELLEPS